MREIRLFLTRRCNFDCAFCVRHDVDAREFRGLADLLEEARESRDERSERVILTGGEPTLHPQFPEIVAALADQTGLPIAVETNGSVIGRPGVASHLSQLGLTHVSVMVPGPDDLATEELTRVRGARAVAATGIAAALDAGLAVSAVLPLTRQRLDRLPEECRDLAETFPTLERVVFQRLAPSEAPPSGASAIPAVSTLAPALARAAEVLRDRRIPMEMGAGETVPFCLAAGLEEVPELFRLPRQSVAKWIEERRERGHAIPCGACAMAPFCPGLGDDDLAGEPDPRVALPDEAISAWSAVLEPLTNPDHGLFDLTSEIESDGERHGVYTIRLTPRCNIRCQHCWWTDWGRPDTPIELAKRQVQRALDAGHTYIAISGGEPTIVPGLEDLIAHIRSQSDEVLIEVQTNALRCANRDYTKALVDAGLDTTFTTFLGSTKAVYEEETLAPGTFEKVVHGIHLLQEFGVVVVLNYVVNALNYEDLPQFVRWFHREFPHEGHENPVYINLCAAQPINPDLLAMDHLFPPYPVMKPFFWEAVNYCLEHGMVVSGLNSISGIPHCVLDGDSRIFDPGERQFSSANEDIFTYIDVCDSCILKGDVCQGIRRNYLKLHGPEGFAPVTADMRKDYPPEERLWRRVERRIPRTKKALG